MPQPLHWEEELVSVEPPSSDRPTGPPSGPLTGPTQPSTSDPTPTQPGGRPPLGPRSGGSGAGDGGGSGGAGGRGGPSEPGGPLGPGESGQGKGPDRPWWKSAPRIALITGVLVAAVVLGLVFTRSNHTTTTGSEVFLQAAGKSGPDPFTESTATDSSTAPQTPAASTASEPASVTRGVDGSAPGLYGGTRNVSPCDVEKQIGALRADPAKNKAFASTEGIQPSEVPAYLRSLTPVQLRMDTRVTNHGYRAGAVTSYQAVLQTGTAVLVDGHGVPRVRCGCGNPLLAPVAQHSTPKPTGDSWPSYRTQNVVVVAPSTTIINVFVIFDPDHDEWIARHKGDTGHHDQKTHPPANPTPSVSVSSRTPSSESPKSPSPKSPSPKSPSPKSSTPSASSSAPSPSSSSPSSPESKSPSTEPPSTTPTTPTTPTTSTTSTSGSASSSLTTEPSSASSPALTSSLSSAPGPSTISPGL